LLNCTRDFTHSWHNEWNFNKGMISRNRQDSNPLRGLPICIEKTGHSAWELLQSKMQGL
jgi:hypothetical protein